MIVLRTKHRPILCITTSISCAYNRRFEMRQFYFNVATSKLTGIILLL